jgi:hypothetical protein
MTSLHYLRNSELAPELAPRLAPFISAYKWDRYRVAFEESYDRRVRLKELAEEGVEPVPQEGSFTEDFEELYFSTHGYYPDEHPDLNDNQEEVR